MSKTDWMGVGDNRPVGGRDQSGGGTAPPKMDWKGEDDSRASSGNSGGARSIPVKDGKPAAKGPV